MSIRRSTYLRPRRSWAVTTVVVALLLGAALTGALVYQLLSGAPPAAARPPSGSHAAAEPRSPLSQAYAPDEKDGILPDGTSVFDDRFLGITRLEPELLAALRAAAREADAEGIEFQVTSGWRSKRYQKQLQRDAVAEYGSREEAARWVASPSRSAHVSGRAVDLGPFDATYWLEQNGAAFGLCRTYANESWHFELRPEAAEQGCPEMYADPTERP